MKGPIAAMATLLLAGTTPLLAQTCAAPAPVAFPNNGGATLSGTTCGGDTTAAGYCAGNFDAPGPAYVFQATFDDTRTFTHIDLDGGAAGFDPVVYLSPVASGCGTNGPCSATGDATVDLLAGDIPNGDWFIVVTAATINGPGSCGIFTLTSDGSVPVGLRSFEIL